MTNLLKLEIPSKNCGVCIVCKTALGFFMKETQSGKHRKVFWFSNKEHEKLKCKRSLCVDCFVVIEQRFPKQPNMPTYDLCLLLGVEHDEVSKLTKARAVTLDGLVEKYGVDEGSERFEKYRERQAYTASSEYFKEKFGWSEEEAKNFHKSRSCTLENLVKRHGEKIGNEKWRSYVERQEYTKSVNFYIEQFGKEEGERLFEETSAKKGTSIKSFVKRGMSIEDARDKLTECVERNSKKPFSVSSKKADEFIRGLCDTLSIDIENVYCAESKKGEYGKLGQNSYYRYDFVDTSRGLCIEFQGDHYHGNPSIYSADDFLNGRGQSGRTAQKAWDDDKLKRETIESHGFKYVEVWESDYDISKEEIFNKIKQEYYSDESIN